jgi:hypothetical protein
MKRKKSFCLCAFFVTCTVTPIDQISGTITETETGEISGFVYHTDGKPAEKADVIVRVQKKAGLNKIKVDSFSVVSCSTAAALETDSSGYFKIDSVKSGVYFIEIILDKKYGAYFKAELSLDNLICHKDSIFLDTLSFVHGYVRPPEKNTIILTIYELDRHFEVDFTGYVYFESVPKGEYTIIFTTNDKDIELPAKATLSVNDNDTTRIDTLSNDAGIVEIKGKIHE